jgi:hypothetical protein
MIVQHKKGEPAGGRSLGLAGYCKSYWSKDGWHDDQTGKVVEAPKEPYSELSKPVQN